MIPFVVTVLINAVWQPAVIALIAWAALRLSRCSNATTRHAVWTVALVASVAIPFVSAASLALPHPKASVAPVLTSQQSREATPAGPVRVHHVPAANPQPVQSSTLQSLPVLVRHPQISVQPSIAQIAALVWSIVALFIIGRLGLSFFYLERLKHDALPLSVERRHELSRWDRAEKGARDVRICVSDEISVPIAVGIFDAMILLPSDLVNELDSPDLDRILLHELAHVRRSDDWVNLFERVALALFFFSPGMYWIARQMDLEREVACDDWVLAQQAAENVSYARCLARIVEMTQWPYRALAAPGVFVTRKSMSIRIERLLARGRDIRIRLALVPSLLSLAAITAVVIAGGFVSPTIAYTMSNTVVTPAPKAKSMSSTVAKAKMKPRNVAVPTLPPSPLIAMAPASKAEGASPKPVATTIVRMQTIKNVRTQTVTGAGAETIAKDVARATSSASTLSDELPKGTAVATAGYLDELRAAGLTNLDADTVIELKSVGVTGEYIKQMHDAGLTNVTAKQLVELKSVGVTPQYVSAMRSAGLTATDARVWTELKSVGVTPDYVAGMVKAGLNSNDPRMWTELKSVGVTPDYVSMMRNAGFAASDARGWSEMKSVGVTPDYVSGLQRAGITDLTMRSIVEFKSIGVTPAYIQDLANAGYPHLSAHQYSEMKSLGIDGAYIQNLARHGFTKLSVQKLIEFKATGIEPK